MSVHDTANPAPKTLFEKVWDAHVVRDESGDAPALLYIDLHLIHEVTSPQAFGVLDQRGITVRRPDRTVATCDHSTPTGAPLPDGSRPYATPENKAQVEKLAENCAKHGVTFHGWESDHRGVVHVMGPELGLTQPGMTIVCGDSHTATHGAFGALAFGIGTTEVSHVLASQCLLQRKPKTMAVTVTGELQPGVTAKDLILAIIAQIGCAGGTGHVIEYRGPAVEALSMEGRMTVCNMSIEAGARAGLIAPDATTIDWLRGRENVPQGEAFDAAAEHWLSLRTDEGATFDTEVFVDASAIKPMISWGINPGQGAAIEAATPTQDDADTQKALNYMGLDAGADLKGTPIDLVFVGSCTNGRLPDLRAAADVLRGRQVADSVRMMVVPGSVAVKAQAEAEGLDQVFRDAGAEWREAGCSMCLAMNGDIAQPGERVVSTSNRNFEGRQGPGARTMLASPETAAACAVAGHVVDAASLPSVAEAENV